MRYLRFLAALMGFAPALLPAATQSFVHDLQFFATPERESHTVRILVIKPDRPLAIAVLFAGGRGVVTIADDGTAGSQNFLVRSRDLFVRHGLMVAVVSAPSDRLGPAPDGQPIGLSQGFRRSAEHAEDIAALMTYLRGEAPGLPLWLVGTSRGSTSVAYVAMRKAAAGGPDGIVLTSSIVVPVPPATAPIDSDSLLRVGLSGNSLGLTLSQITVPTLVMHHADDACFVTPYAGVDSLLKLLTNTSRLEGARVKGGSKPIGDPCEALHYHGFIGIEAAVAARIAHWIKTGHKE